MTTENPSQSEASTRPTDSRAVVEQFLGGNLRVLADDVEIWSTGLIVTESGEEEITGWGPQEKTAWKRIGRKLVEVAAVPYTLTPTAWTVDGDRVAVEASGHMVLKNGAEYANKYHLCYVVRDGRIVSLRHYCDTALFDRIFRAPGALHQ